MTQTALRLLTLYFPFFLFSWFVTFTLASVSHTQFIVNGLVSVGAEVGIGDRVSMSAHDWVGFAPGYGMFIGTGLLIAFVTTALLTWALRKRLPNSAHYLYPLAGACALATILLSMRYLFGIVAIAGARDFGFVFQLLSGAVGGWVFIYALSRRRLS